MHILVVEDERRVADALHEGLKAEGHVVTVERHGDRARTRVGTDAFDLVLLDLTLPGCDGLDVLHALRARDTRTLVLVLTARDAVDDRVAGLNAGADDYLIKPFAFAELLARIRSLSRRGPASEVTRVRIGPLSLDRASRRVTRGDDAIELTTREYELLHCLMRFQGDVVPRDVLAREVWKETARSTSLDNVIDVHIARLRRKIDAGQSTPLIHTVRGVGFAVKDSEP